MVSEPSADKTPNRNQRGVHDQDEPEVRSTHDEERHIHADVVGPIRQRQERDGSDALRNDARPARVGSARLQQAPDSECERQHSQKVNPAMGDCQSAPHADQAYADNGRKPDVLTYYDASRWNPPGKEQGQEKGVIDVRGSEGC